jgi:hypothetical protein
MEKQLKTIIRQPMTPLTCRIIYTGQIIMFSVIKNTYNKKIKGHILLELLTATEKLKNVFDN